MSNLDIDMLYSYGSDQGSDVELRCGRVGRYILCTQHWKEPFYGCFMQREWLFMAAGYYFLKAGLLLLLEREIRRGGDYTSLFCVILGGIICPVFTAKGDCTMCCWERWVPVCAAASETDRQTDTQTNRQTHKKAARQTRDRAAGRFTHSSHIMSSSFSAMPKWTPDPVYN